MSQYLQMPLPEAQAERSSTKIIKPLEIKIYKSKARECFKSKIKQIGIAQRKKRETNLLSTLFMLNVDGKIFF